MVSGLLHPCEDRAPGLQLYHRDQAHAEHEPICMPSLPSSQPGGVLAPGVSEQDAADTIHVRATDESVYLRLSGECGWTQTAAPTSSSAPSQPP